MIKHILLLSVATVFFMTAMLGSAAPDPECGFNLHSKCVASRKDDLMGLIVNCLDSGRHITMYRDTYPDIEVYCYGDEETEEEWRRREIRERIAARRAEMAKEGHE